MLIVVVSALTCYTRRMLGRGDGGQLRDGCLCANRNDDREETMQETNGVGRLWRSALLEFVGVGGKSRVSISRD
jgi:hypothetical protein